MSKRITPEQKAKSAERRERFKKIVSEVAAMSDEQREALAARMGALVTVEGRSLSPCNSQLIAMQNPTATIVGGFRQWLDQGRCVRKGEHGMMIWVPTFKKSDGESGEGEGEKKGFIVGTIFDISQTDEARVEEAIAA